MISVDDAKERALRLKRSGDFQGAKKTLTKVVEPGLRDTMVPYGLGKICYLLEQSKESVQYYLAGLHINLNAAWDRLKQNDPNVKMYLDQLPPDLVNSCRNYHPVAPLALTQNSTLMHVSHSIIDLNFLSDISVQCRRNVSRYREGLQGASRLQPDISIEQHYIQAGIDYAMQLMKWNRIDEPVENHFYVGSNFNKKWRKVLSKGVSENGLIRNLL